RRHARDPERPRRRRQTDATGADVFVEGLPARATTTGGRRPADGIADEGGERAALERSKRDVREHAADDGSAGGFPRRRHGPVPATAHDGPRRRYSRRPRWSAHAATTCAAPPAAAPARQPRSARAGGAPAAA